MKLNLSLVQMAVVPAAPEENLRKAEGWIAEAAGKGSQVVCFPEMWTTGFQWAENERMAVEHEKIIDRVAGLARQYRIWINGSMLALDRARKVSNASILFDPQGERAAIYRKAHLFSLMHEDRHMAPGQSLTAADAPWGRTGLSICYDLRFPEMFRTYALKGVRIVLSPAAFPHPRLEHWKILVRARAIENQMFLVATNRVGTEDLGADGSVAYFGHSVIVDPWGGTVAEAGEAEETLLTATIDLGQVEEIRGKMTVLKDRRPDLYELG